MCDLAPQGVAAMGYEQERASERSAHISTVATLFSGVTASTLQMSMSVDGNMFIVNALWLCALIFSVGAMLNNLLSITWRQTKT